VFQILQMSLLLPFAVTLKRFGVAPWVRQLVAGLTPRRPGFDHGLVHVGFVVDKEALGQVYPLVLRVFPLIFIPSVLHYLEKDKK
jgi:hypothetical protein